MLARGPALTVDRLALEGTAGWRRRRLEHGPRVGGHLQGVLAPRPAVVSSGALFLSSGRPPSPWHRLRFRGEPPGLTKRFAEKHLYLSRRAAELVAGPANQSVVYQRVHPDQYVLTFGHGEASPRIHF